MQTILIKSEDIAAKSPETEQRKSFRVAVSGFGPFQNVPVNPSWQCLKPLQKAKLLTTAGAHVILACTEVSVTYEDVERYALRSHLEQSDLDGSTYDLYLHIGVSALQPNLLLERRARRFGYRRLDVNNCSAPSKGGDTEHCGFGVTHEWEREALPDELYTSVPLELIKSQLAPKWGDRLQTSSDPGLYLCEYIYYSSLANAMKVSRQQKTPSKPVMFLHIPSANDQKTLDDITEFVKDLICATIDNLHH